MSGVKGVLHWFSQRDSEMIKKRLKAAGLWIAFALCIWCSGCGRREQVLPEKFRLEGSRGAEDQDMLREFSEGKGSTGNQEGTGDIQKTEELQNTGTAGSENEEQGAQRIVVYVCGAVNTPGVYELQEGARLFEAIACAGGVREDGAEESINQAQAVSDGERLYIPTEEEVRQGLDAYLQTGAAAGASPVGSADGRSGRDAAGKVNINTASKEELTALNGIGDTRAASILAYRESYGPFGSIEDLMKVEGIKEGVYNKLKDDITVN